jgi:hypothetical protein
MSPTRKELKMTSHHDKTATMIRIVDRAIGMAAEHRIKYDRMSAILDLTFAARQFDLDLAALEEADDFNFAHDVFGIANHINRTTGKMEDNFIPRFARF